MATNNDRKEFIQQALNMDVPLAGINQALKDYGFGSLNKQETLEYNEGTYGQGLLPKFVKGGKDTLGGLATIGGMVGQALIDDKLRNELFNTAGNYLKDKTTGDVLVDATNLMLSPYNNLTIQNALTQPISETITDITSGAAAHPFDATLDILGTLGTASNVLKGTKVGKQLDKAITKGVNKLPLPPMAKSLIKGSNEYQINDILSSSKFAPSARIEELSNINANIKKAELADLKQAIKNLEEGTLSGSKQQIELTSQIKKLNQEIDSMMIERGLAPDTIKEDSIAQYVTRNLQGKGKDIPVAEIKRMLREPEYTTEGLNKSDILRLANEGEDLYTKGFIYPVRHSTDFDTARKGFLSEDTKRLFGRNERIYGTQDYEDLAKGLKKEGSTSTLNKLNKTEQTLGAIEEINNTLGRKINSLDDIANLGKDEVLMSPRLLKEKLGTSILQGGDINNDLKTLARGLNKDEIARYADDLYVYSKDDLNALNKAYGSAKLGFTNNPLTSSGKRSALATLSYIIGNLTTNVGMNLTEGITPSHYIEALTNLDKFPKALKRSTTYSGYLGDAARTDTGLKDIYSQLFDKVKTGTPLERLDAINEMSTIPIFKAAGNIEMIDRGANYLKQAERYAKETGKTVQEVIELAKKNNGNNATYRELLRRVNNTLGDYSGRNYYAPQAVNELLNITTPFYRPFTQGTRQFIYQTLNHPFANQFLNRNPARVGEQISDIAEEELGVAPHPEYSGGFPVLSGDRKNPSRVIVNPYHAYTAVGQVLGNPKEVLGGNMMPLAPVLGLAGLNRYGSEPMLPNQITINGRKVQLDNNGNEISSDTFGNRIRLALAQSGQAYIAPINQMNSIVLPTIAAITGKGYRRPTDISLMGQIDEFSIPGIMESDMNSRAKVGLENLLPQLGFRMSDTWRDNKEISQRQRARGLRQLDKKRKRNERR